MEKGLFRFVRVSAGVGRETVEAEAETPLGREVFAAPNTLSRALFALSAPSHELHLQDQQQRDSKKQDNEKEEEEEEEEEEEAAMLTVLSSSSRLCVVGAAGRVALRALHDATLVRRGDLLQLLGDPLLLVYRLDWPRAAPAPKRRKSSATPLVVVAPPPTRRDMRRSDDSRGEALALPLSTPPLSRSSSSSSTGARGFVPVPFKFYRNLVALEGFDNAQNVLNLRPLFAEPGVLRICLTSYELEADWLLQAFPVLQTVDVFVACRAPPVPLPFNWRHISPKVPPYGTCHGKLMLLYFEKKLRVILTSANHIEGDHLFKSNGIWTQEFPLLAAPLASQPPIGYRADCNDFGAVLQDYLEQLGCPAVYADLRRFDFSGAAVALVSSVPGAHKVRMKYGYARLAQVLAAEKCLNSEGSPLIMQCSSLGKLSQPYIDAMQSALGGGKVQLIWPSTEFIRTSLQGYGAGGSVCFNAKNLIPPTKRILRLKYEGVAERQNVSPHIKTMFRLKPGGGREVSWLYMGSHNLSKSSWGEEQLQGKQFKVLSFEIGVVFLPSLVSRVAGAPVSLVLGNSNALDARVPGQIVLPIPFRYPASPYSANYSGGPDDVPWQWDVPQSAPDVHQRPWPGIGSF